MFKDLIGDRLAGPLSCLVAAVTFTASVPAIAQTSFPSGPVTIVVGFTPGGSNDVVARIVAPKVSQILGVPVIVENKPGAAGAIGMAAVVNAKPDGHTVAVGSTSVLTIGPVVSKNLPYKPDDLQAVATLAASVSVIAVNPNLPVKTMAELIERSKHQQVSLASAGVGGISHLNIEDLRVKTGGDLLHVAYKGAAGGVVDVAGGQVDGIVMDYSALQGAIHQKRLRAIAASKSIDGIEASEFVMAPWYGVMTSAKVPAETIHKLHDAFTKAMEDPAVLRQLAPLGMEPFVHASSEEAGQFIKEDAEKWAQIVEVSGLKLN